MGNHETFAAFSDGALAAAPPRLSGFELWWEDARESLRRRGGSATLVVILHALLLLLLLRLAPPFQEPVPMAEPTTVTLIPGEEAAPAEAPKPAEKAQPSGGGAPAKAAKPPPVPTPKPQPAPDQPSKEPALKLWEGMEKFNLANVPSAGAGRSAGAPGASAGAGDSAIGTAPGGQPLYAAQWYRRPTSAELNGYLPPRMQNGWGMVACRTVEDYRVEDCKEVGQSPAGSGLSRAVRQAAWQFRVRPPRIGGKSMVGEWVRIRIEWSEGIPQ